MAGSACTGARVVNLFAPTLSPDLPLAPTAPPEARVGGLAGTGSSRTATSRVVVRVNVAAHVLWGRSAEAARSKYQRWQKRHGRKVGGGFEIGRVLPMRPAPDVGAFIYFDHVKLLDLPPSIRALPMS